MERLSIDFKGPLSTTSRNTYILTVVDEYSRFPFAFPVPNMHSSTVIKCLDHIFTLCGMPSYIHSDRGTSFLSQELKEYLSQRGREQPNPHPTTLLTTGRWKDTIMSSGKLYVFLSSPRICLTPNGRLSFQMLCIPFDRSFRHQQTQPRMRDSSASSVAHPVAHRCLHGCIPQDPPCSGDSSEQAKRILLWTK